MASVQTECMPQVGFKLRDQPFGSSLSIPFDSIRISGLHNRAHGRDNRDAAFWANTLVASVDGQRYLAKLYTPGCGGEKAFEHDLDRLMKAKGSNLPRVFAYSNDATTPCIVFSASRIIPFHAYPAELLRASPGTALQDTWQLLIDMKASSQCILNAVEGMIRNYPTLPTGVLCDALAKASVDDRGSIVLTPEIDGRPFDCAQEVEELVKTAWAEFFRAGKYRPLRALGYALTGNAYAVLGKSPREFETPASALEYLQQFWVPPSRRYLSWPSNSKGFFEPGDIGVFEMQIGKGQVFRKLSSVAAELGGVVTKISAGDFVEVQPGVQRATCLPMSEDDRTSSVMMSWSTTLSHSKTEWHWLCENATRLATDHGVPPVDLVLLTKTNHGLSVRSLETLRRRIRKPIYFYVHIDETGSASELYWTFKDSPLCSEEIRKLASNPDLAGLPLPAPEMYFGDKPYPARYLQLESADL
ncbi:hypothetical protein FRB90_000755 [Tulasnella sp. 427]|nr:hypothetical protein FRB90_000755 [Tulasnella sp. 427]